MTHWDGTDWDGTDWDETGRDETGRDRTGPDRTGRPGAGRTGRTGKEQKLDKKCLDGMDWDSDAIGTGCQTEWLRAGQKNCLNLRFSKLSSEHDGLRWTEATGWPHGMARIG